MRKSLVILSVSFLTCATAAAVIATNAMAQAPAPNMPVQLAQATPPAPGGAGRRGPVPGGLAARGPARPTPTAAQRTARREAMCQEGTARAAGRFASLEVRLNLTGPQTSAFERWRDLRLATAKRQAADCIARPLPPQGGPRGARGPNATPPSPVERLTRQETMLQRRLADIQAERPALEALYTSLSPAQRQTLARAERGGMRGRMMGFHRGPGMGGPRGNMMFRRGGMGMGMQGPMGRGPMGGQRGPGNPPPPAP